MGPRSAPGEGGGQPPGPLTSRACGLVRLPPGKRDRELLEEALAEKYEKYDARTIKFTLDIEKSVKKDVLAKTRWLGFD